MDYSFLQKPLSDFIEQKLSEAEPEGTADVPNRALWIDPETNKTPFRQLYESVGLTEPKFARAYLDPWKDLSLAQMQDVLTYLNFFIGRKKSVVLTAKRQEHFKAIHWLIVHLTLLNLSGLNVLALPIIKRNFGSEMEILPYRQCFVCGKTSSDFTVDHIKYCHMPGCDTSDPNGSAHEVGCCYKDWRIRRESAKKSLREAENSTEGIKRFLKFCEKQFANDMALQYDVRPKNMVSLLSL